MLVPSLVFLFLVCAPRLGRCLESEGGQEGSSSGGGPPEDVFDGYFDDMRRKIGEVIARTPPSLMRKLQSADVSARCSLGLLKLLRGVRNLEPWAMKLFDASAKYPTGLFHGTRVDLGAFDECLETTVVGASGHITSRGQYCNLRFYIKNATAWQKKMGPFLSVLHPTMRYFKDYFFLEEVPIIRLGICFLEDCTQRDLQALVDSVKPSILDIEVSNCLTAEREPWSTTQKSIVIFLGFLVITVIGCTCVDLFMQSKRKLGGKRSALVPLVTAFSATANTQALVKAADKDSDLYVLQFLHGLRLFSLAYIVLGHCYQVMSDTWSRLLNMLVSVDEWSNMMVVAGFSCVDTFFFLRQVNACCIGKKCMFEKVSTIFFSRSHPRISLPARKLKRVLSYRDCYATEKERTYGFRNWSSSKASKNLHSTILYHNDVAGHWWQLLLQIRNYFELNQDTVLGHTWYLAADFQLFLVSLLVLLLLKSRKTLALGAFAGLCLLGCAIATWTVSNPEITPFVVFPAKTPQMTMKTANEYYVRPFYHAVCYFSGCMAFLVIDDFRKRKLSKAMQFVGWCAAMGCSVSCVFMKLAWYTTATSTSEAGDLFGAFFDRILWSLFLAWVTLACSTGQGGVLGRFLSMKVFVPFSRLSFGVYLIHYPFIEIMLHASRERLLWSHFSQVTLFFGVLCWSFILAYLAYLLCEAPTAALDKLAFQRVTGKGNARSQVPQPDSGDGVPEKRAEGGRVVSTLTSGKNNGYGLPDPWNGAVRGLSWNSQWMPNRL
ncbi:hypothetical protein V5799_012967 [Amblyomma americanum]|uniref:Nose resistant-to-fluoxetine protein N-terminal domain-containing protein n=1 Tax=Amblyomma americanum TaxID=6943 RepID=A0AAQ4E781_AMBAM